MGALAAELGRLVWQRRPGALVRIKPEQNQSLHLYRCINYAPLPEQQAGSEMSAQRCLEEAGTEKVLTPVQGRWQL